MQSDQNPYLPPETTPSQPDRVDGSTKVHVGRLLMFFGIGMLAGSFLIPNSVFPPSLNPAQGARASAVGGLIGMLLYFLIEYFAPKDD